MAFLRRPSGRVAAIKKKKKKLRSEMALCVASTGGFWFFATPSAFLGAPASFKKAAFPTFFFFLFYLFFYAEA
jgi:hypothetical protein